jgi:lipoprotein signal peptidase
MNKYVLLVVLVIGWVVGDLWTKHLAVTHLASYSSRWEHPVVVEVEADDDGKTVEAWAVETFSIDMDDPEEAQTLARIYLVPETGSPVPLRSDDTVQAGNTLQVRHRQVTVVRGFWNHIYVQNFGAAWGMFSQQSEAFRKPFFFGISLLALVVVGTIYRKLRDDQWMLAAALASIVGGALGNFVDRIRYGYVIDFIDWYVMWGGRERHWPTFNVADIGISVGVSLMLLDILFGKHDDEPAKAPVDPAPTPADASTTDDAAA